MSANNELAIKTTQSPPAGDEDDAAENMPLSPASVRSYQKHKAKKTRKKLTPKQQPFSEEESDSDEFEEDDEGVSYESDKKSDDDDEEDEDEDEDEFDAAHLDPRLEALDGTTKLKSAAEKEKEGKEQDDDEDEEDADYSNDEEGESAESAAVGRRIVDLTLDSAKAPVSTKAVIPDITQSPLSTVTPGIVLNGDLDTSAGGELYQDPTSTGISASSAAAIAAFRGQEERLQEPVKPHIALPCLVETAKNPARTRITLKYSGNDHAAHKATNEDREQKTSTRGRKNYMVATDLSGESWHATEWAINTILRNGDELNVVTIVEDDKVDDKKAVKKGVQAEMREDAEKLTKNIHEQLEHTCLRDITVIIHIIAATKSMGAKELLIEMIDDLEDLSTVIVGSRGRGAIKGLLLGSISNFLVHNSSVPVMVVRAPKKSKGKKKARRGRVMEQTRSVREANLKYEQAFAEDD
ncbi:hypothetical protein EDD11_007036 [Mortierella claussenii]|nr:hypothetical protein EDD11_007036 [Mortierella claussenii]